MKNVVHKNQPFCFNCLTNSPTLKAAAVKNCCELTSNGVCCNFRCGRTLKIPSSSLFEKKIDFNVLHSSEAEKKLQLFALKSAVKTKMSPVL